MTEGEAGVEGGHLPSAPAAFATRSARAVHVGRSLADAGRSLKETGQLGNCNSCAALYLHQSILRTYKIIYAQPVERHLMRITL